MVAGNVGGDPEESELSAGAVFDGSWADAYHRLRPIDGSRRLHADGIADFILRDETGTTTTSAAGTWRTATSTASPSTSYGVCRTLGVEVYVLTA